MAVEDPTWKCLVEHLILKNTDFIVFIDDKMDIDWKSTTEYDEVRAPTQAEFNDVINEVAAQEVIPCCSGDVDNTLKYKRLLGEAVAMALKQDYANARSMIEAAKAFLRARNQEMTRFWYLTASTSVAALIVVAGFVLWSTAPSLFREHQGMIRVLTAAASAGAIGAFLSVFLRLGKAELDTSAAKKLFQMEGCCRILAGSISGFCAAIVVKSGLLMPGVARGPEGAWGILLTALLAGASERWIDSIMTKAGATPHNNPQQPPG